MGRSVEEERPVGAVKGGRSPAQRTLDGDHRTRQSSLAECRHGAAFSNGSKSPWMQNQLFEAALGIAKPWYVQMLRPWARLLRHKTRCECRLLQLRTKTRSKIASLI